MLVVTVYLDSAIHPSRSKELARMHISNIDHQSMLPPGLHSYDVRTLRGRSKEDLDKRIVNRQGTVKDVPSDDHHVWHLVAEALKSVEYDKRPGKGKQTKRKAG
jgi:hypothetical protein